MPALPTIPSVIRCVFKGRTSAGTPWVNVIHVADAGPDTFPVKVAKQEVIWDKFWSSAGFGGGITGVASWVHSGWRYDAAVYTALDGVTASLAFAKSVVGTAAGDALPPDTAVTLSLRTPKRGPRYRGRVYLAGFAESACDSSGRLATAHAAGLDALAEKVVTEEVAVACNLVVASYKWIDAEEVTSAFVDTVFDRQRRRRS